VSPGSLATWQRKGSKNGDQNFEKIWTRAFKSPAVCLSWCAGLNYLVVGCEDGTLVPIEVKPESPMNYTELREYKLHKDAVSGSYIDVKKNYMYSISEDKYLRVFDFKTKEVIANNQISKGKLTKMIVHQESMAAFISTKAGELAVVDLNTVSWNFDRILFLESSDDQENHQGWKEE
jgi:WD40 repeat protein